MEDQSIYIYFMKKYQKEHELCPKCGNKGHSITLAAYAFDKDKPNNYKDLNKCVCSKCKDVHVMHDRISKSEYEDKL